MSEKKANLLLQFEQVLKKASDKHASDLHLKAGLPPIIRVNGQLFYLGDTQPDSPSRLSLETINAFISVLMTPRQYDRFEAGEEIDLSYEVSGGGRFRINICRQRSKPRLVCRYIPDLIPAFQELCLPPVVETLAQATRGLVLVTGATGSGKSTTLASMVDFIARNRSCHIVTIEDPIEFILKDRKAIITQREIGMDTSGFARALKYALRQDPDVILVGEMRDEETISMALNAAETGHLVLSTLHTVDAPETINRILGSVSSGMQVALRAQLASVLVGVVSQRLIRRKDNRGRIPATEVLVCSQRVKDMIADPTRTVNLTQVIEEGEAYGMQTFDQSLMKLFKEGFISREEAIGNCTNQHDFLMRLQGVVQGDWRSQDGRQPPPLGEEDEADDITQGEAANIEIEGVINGMVPRRRKG